MVRDVSRAKAVRDRAGGVCEYCHPPERPPTTSFHIEHIIARKHRGVTKLENLALSCVRCNLHKGTDLTGIDPASGAIVLLFHPRRDKWSEHFYRVRDVITGLTPIGRTTIATLQMNLRARRLARLALIRRKQMPPYDPPK